MGSHFRYSVHDNDDFDGCYSFTSNFDDDDIGWLAEEAAADFHSHHDGWESNWDKGITFWLWTESGKLLGSCSVTREMEPRFHASQPTPEPPNE